MRSEKAVHESRDISLVQYPQLTDKQAPQQTRPEGQYVDLLDAQKRALTTPSNSL